MKASQTLGQSTGLNLGTRRPALLGNFFFRSCIFFAKHFSLILKLNKIFIENREDAVDEQEIENYLVSIVALQRLMQAELSLMVGIIPIKHHHQVFQIIIQESLSNIVHEGEVCFCSNG